MTLNLEAHDDVFILNGQKLSGSKGGVMWKNKLAGYITDPSQAVLFDKYTVTECSLQLVLFGLPAYSLKEAAIISLTPRFSSKPKPIWHFEILPELDK